MYIFFIIQILGLLLDSWIIILSHTQEEKREKKSIFLQIATVRKKNCHSSLKP